MIRNGHMVYRLGVNGNTFSVTIIEMSPLLPWLTQVTSCTYNQLIFHLVILPWLLSVSLFPNNPFPIPAGDLPAAVAVHADHGDHLCRRPPGCAVQWGAGEEQEGI